MMIVTWSSASWKAPRTRNRLWVSSAFRKASHAGKGYRHLPFPSCSRIKPGTRALYRRLLDQRILPVLIFEPIWMRRLGGWSPLSAHRWRPCDGSDASPPADRRREHRESAAVVVARRGRTSLPNSFEIPSIQAKRCLDTLVRATFGSNTR